MRAEVTAHNAQLRHPQEVQAVLSKLGANSAQDVTWEYDLGVRINPGFSLAHELKGPERFQANAHNHLLSLVGRRVGNPHKKARAELDSVALAQDPARIPMELYALPDRPDLPAGRSLWLWKGNQVAAPGWNDAVLVGGVTDGKTTVLRLATDTSWPHAAELLRNEAGKPGWEGTTTDASGRLHGFGTALLATMGHWARTGELRGATAAASKALDKLGVRTLTEKELDQAAAGFTDGFITGKDGANKLLADILEAMGGAGLLDDGVDESTGSPVWITRKAQGRKWSWGQSLSVKDLEGYAELMRADKPASFSAMDVLGGAFNPKVMAAREQASEVIKSIALGVAPDEAFERATGRKRVTQRLKGP